MTPCALRQKRSVFRIGPEFPCFFFFFEQLLHVLYEVSTLIFREGSSLLQVLHPSHLPCNLH